MGNNAFAKVRTRDNNDMIRGFLEAINYVNKL